MVILWFTTSSQDVKTEYPEDLEDPEASVAPWAETVSAAEQAAVLKANAQELDAAQKLGELGMVVWY